MEREDSTVCGKLFHSFRPTIENTLFFFLRGTESSIRSADLRGRPVEQGMCGSEM